jgi:sarcosine oxidase
MPCHALSFASLARLRVRYNPEPVLAIGPSGPQACRMQMPQPQIVVIGLGATGSAALYRLAQRGVRTIGIDQFDVGHDRGSSHGPTRIFRVAHYENPAYVPLLRRARELWRELEATCGQKLLVTTGIAELGPPGGELLRGTLAAAARHDVPHEVLGAAALMRRYPAFNVPQSYAAVIQPDGGTIEAATALDGYIRAAADAGAIIRVGEKVLAIEPHHNGVRIITDRDRLEADGVVVAAGPWTAGILPDLHLPLRVTRQVVGWFEPDDAHAFGAEHFPVFLLESQFGIHYGLPYYRRMGVKVAKHHHFNEAVDPDRYDMTVSASDEAAIRAPLREFLPGANGRLRGAQTCLYTMTPDETFVIDRLPGSPHVVIASPCCGHGFKFSPVVGEIVSDLVTCGSTRHDITPFRLARFSQLRSGERGAAP